MRSSTKTRPPARDIVPPGEQGKLYVGPVVGPDDHKARPKPVIDGEATVVPPASKSECPSWLRPVPKTERRIDGGPPVAKSSAETEAQRQRVHSLFEAGGTTVASPSMTGFGLALTGQSSIA